MVFLPRGCRKTIDSLSPTRWTKKVKNVQKQPKNIDKTLKNSAIFSHFLRMGMNRAGCPETGQKLRDFPSLVNNEPINNVSIDRFNDSQYSLTVRSSSVNSMDKDSIADEMLLRRCLQMYARS
jgi:hypothetical protein